MNLFENLVIITSITLLLRWAYRDTKSNYTISEDDEYCYHCGLDE